MGNPAAVVPLDAWPSEEWMQNVALEMNQAETAFFVPEGSGYRLRWFTPAVEVDLCGHATLASAHVLFTELGMGDEVTFQTRSGPLACKRTEEGIAMDFPSEPPYPEPFPHDIPGIKSLWSGRNRMDWFVQVASPEEVTSLVPPNAQITNLRLRGLIVTAQGGNGVDFTSRCFFPQSGVNEDPVTGSAHCALAPFWAERLGKSEVTGYQASRRGGTVRCQANENRVILTGHSFTTLKGNLI